MPYTAKEVSILQSERTDDPLSRSYSGMTDAEFLTSITTENRDNPRTFISSGELFESIDNAEFIALSAGDKVRVDRLLGLGAEIIVGPGNAHQAVQELLATFGGVSTTVTTLAALRDVQFSRAAELNLPSPILADVGRTI